MLCLNGSLFHSEFRIVQIFRNSLNAVHMNLVNTRSNDSIKDLVNSVMDEKMNDSQKAPFVARTLRAQCCEAKANS